MASNVINKKYKNILETAHDLFWKHGFRRVPVEEICKKAGVSKMTYYRYFPNKTELAKTVFRKVAEEGKIRYKNLMQENIPAGEKIKKMIEMKTEGTNDISREFLEDFYLGSEPELKKFVEKETALVWESLLTEFKSAQSKGIFRSDFRPEFLIQASYKLTELLNNDKLMELYKSPQEFILELTNFVVRGISPNNT